MMATTSTAEEVSRSAAEPSMFSHVNCEGKSGVSSSFRGLREIRCQGNPVSRKIRGKSGVSSSFLPEKMNRHRAKKARERRIVGSLKLFRWNPAGNQSRPGEIRCQFIILARKDEPTSRQESSGKEDSRKLETFQ